ncbi:MAG: YitT family protein [Bacteroidota bacterium]|nr:YitT family protein [Bacteroidota bacterium]
MPRKKRKINLKSSFFSYLTVAIGAFIIAAGFVLFITPYKIVPGGIYGVSIIIHYLTKGLFSFAPEGLPVGTMGMILDIPITLIGIRILGARFGVKNIFGLVLTAIFIDTLTYFWGYIPLVQNDALLSSIFGGVMFGFGIGLIFKTKGATGGTDTIAMIITKYTRMPLGQLLIYVDSVVVLMGLLAFRDWKIPLYSWIVIFITGKVIDAVMQGFSYDKTVFIISEKYEEIRDVILLDLDRGGTYFLAEGMYEGKPKKVIYTNITRRELATLIGAIKEIDPDAFLSVIDANEIIGHGFKPIREN